MFNFIKGVLNETHLPTTQHTKKANPWLSCKNENQKRAQGD